jgi:hypothetical protein
MQIFIFQGKWTSTCISVLPSICPEAGVIENTGFGGVIWQVYVKMSRESDFKEIERTADWPSATEPKFIFFGKLLASIVGYA